MGDLTGAHPVTINESRQVLLKDRRIRIKDPIRRVARSVCSDLSGKMHAVCVLVRRSGVKFDG